MVNFYNLKFIAHGAGACANGHPLGATGAKLMTTLVHELQRSGKRYGLQAICEGGGTANATIIERC
jgi:acetyl-CoA acetyltransferase